MKRLTGLDWPLWASAVCLLALSVAGAVAITHFDDPNVGLSYSCNRCLMPSRRGSLSAASRTPQPADARSRAFSSSASPCGSCCCRARRFRPTSSAISGTAASRRRASTHTFICRPMRALTGLRDGAIYPYINRADYAPTIYPPASQIDLLPRHPDIRGTGGHEGRHGCVGRRGGLGDSAVARSARTAALAQSCCYAWHPLPLWEFARSGHIDIAAIALLLLAFLAMERRSPILAGMALGAGVLVKVFSGSHRSCTLQALGLAFSDCVHRDRRRSISALCQRGEQGVRFPRPLSHRGGHR